MQLILYIAVKGGGERGYVKSISDRLGRREKTKWEIFGIGYEVEQIDTYFYIGGYRMVNS